MQDNHEYTALPAKKTREDACACVWACQRLNKPVSNKHPCSLWMVFGFLWMVFGFMFVVYNQDPSSPFLSPSLSLGLSLYAVVKIYALRLHCLYLSLSSHFQSLPLSLSLCTHIQSTVHLRIFTIHDIHIYIQTYITARLQ